MSETADPVDWALYYASRGWAVFPLIPRGKLPVIAKRDGGNGFHDASTDAELIKTWWTRWPNANIGLATGHGFDALDIDSWDALHALNAYRAERPMTFGPEVVTGWGCICISSPQAPVTARGSCLVSTSEDWVATSWLHRLSTVRPAGGTSGRPERGPTSRWSHCLPGWRSL